MATKENEELLDPGMPRQTGDDRPDVAFTIELKRQEFPCNISVRLSHVIFGLLLLQDERDHFKGATVEDEDNYFAKQWEAVCQEYICNSHLG